MIVMMLLTTLTLGLQARTVSTLKYMRKAQDFDAALAVADAGLADAVYKIEQGFVTTTTCGGVTTTSLCGSGVSGGGVFNYKAVKIDNTKYFVYSRGEIGGSKKGITARVSRSAMFPYAMFGFNSLTMNGSTSTNGTMNMYVVGAVGAAVQVGSNGTVLCQGTQATNLLYKSFGGYSGCPSTQWSAIEEKHPVLRLDPPPAPHREPSQDQCTATAFDSFGISITNAPGTFAGTVDGGNGNAYVCRRDVTFSGVVGVVNPPLIVYILNDQPVQNNDPRNGCNTLDISNAVVNAGQPAKNVQIFKEGACGLNVGDGNTSDQLTFSGVLYAPKETLTINGGKWFTGSIMVGNVVSNGSPNLVIGYDGDLSSYYGKTWRVSRYAEVPAHELPCLTCPA